MKESGELCKIVDFLKQLSPRDFSSLLEWLRCGDIRANFKSTSRKIKNLREDEGRKKPEILDCDIWFLICCMTSIRDLREIVEKLMCKHIKLSENVYDLNEKIKEYEEKLYNSNLDDYNDKYEIEDIEKNISIIKAKLKKLDDSLESLTYNRYCEDNKYISQNMKEERKTLLERIRNDVNSGNYVDFCMKQPTKANDLFAPFIGKLLEDARILEKRYLKFKQEKNADFINFEKILSAEF